MPSKDPHSRADRINPQRQADESKGKIKQPQQTDATMADKDLARGSEPATHNRR